MEQDKVMQEETAAEETVVEETTEDTVVEEQTDENQDAPTAEVVEDKASEYLERLQRLMAEFDNYRKRSEKEKQHMYDLGVSTVATELIGTVDNFERALKQTCEDATFQEGVNMIYKQLVASLEKLGVTAIEAEGQPFDPAFHSAVFHIEDEALGENVVAEELQKGYCYKEKVIRHSMVKVAN